MASPLTVGALYELHREKLVLKWLAGRAGTDRVIDIDYHHPDAERQAASLVGHLNLIHPNRVQVLGRSGLEYLQNLGKNSHQDALEHLFNSDPALILIADGQAATDEFLDYSARTGTPLLASPLSSHKLASHLQYYLVNLLTEKIILHGVFMEVMGIGVLLAGSSGVGKSELALELLSRGHRLVADDSPEFSRIAPDRLNGTCPPVLSGFLEVRGLGVLNVANMFGGSAVKSSKYLRLIVYLEAMSDEEISRVDRIHGCHQTRTVLEVEIPQVTLPVAPGRNLAVLVEGAVRNYLSLLNGYNAAEDFIAQQRLFIARDQT
ncbi:MAG: HPr(Ser) kinase/phosphatase [Gammaproteobacteria bacterium]|nr:HPr(Ser) kinase/phosphatase [Gammaproteobacteria bacterium]